MRKFIKSLMCLLMCACLICSPALTVLADGASDASGSGSTAAGESSESAGAKTTKDGTAEEGAGQDGEAADGGESADNEEDSGVEMTELTIASLEEFLAFSENCRLDSYSQNLAVILEADIDLSGTDFAGVPIFCGVFDGNGHAITGLSIDKKGSDQGLFRYLTAGGVVKNLAVSGQVTPGGSRDTVGGIVGSNGGTIVNCSFSGTVSGADNIGGIAGRNEVTGIIEDCSTEGTVYGNHFVGGMAGENLGVVRRCTNKASLNTTAAQNNVDLSDITLGTLTGTEWASTVTDVGGIAGVSSGVIRDCVNYGTVGYQHMGYNIGGIAGSQSGYVADCINYGEIYGRKEVGGIVGQMEPAAFLEYEADTLQILQQQLLTMSEIVDRTKANTDSSTTVINNQVAVLRGLVNDAQAALDVLTVSLDELKNQEFPDLDSMQAALNTLKSSLTAMPTAIKGLTYSVQNAVTTLKNDMEALSNQMNAIGNTLEGASDNLGGSITDVSDADTEEDLTSKLANCENRGNVSADINVGGIVGAIALENDLDPEDDVEISGEMSLNFENEYRSVIMDCENSGIITVKKQRAGGIVGWMSLGLVKDSLNTGEVNGVSADYVGGIAGQSDGYIRRCSAKCPVTGVDYVGGIAGKGTVVSDCRSMVLVTGEERLGGILGFTDGDMRGDESTRTVLGNVYRVVASDIGGIDGISYAGAAEALSDEEFFKLEGLAETFRTVQVAFIFEDGTEQILSVETGGTLNIEEIPAVPEKEGYIGEWRNLNEADLAEISFDMTYETVYTSLVSVIQSEQTNDAGLPILLAQGVFLDTKELSLSELEESLDLGERETLIEGWEIVFPEAGEAITMRYLIPEDYRDKDLKLMVKLTGRVWDEVEYTVDGSYLVFSADAEDTAFCLIEKAPDYRGVILAAGAAAAILMVAGVIVIRKKRGKRKTA